MLVREARLKGVPESDCDDIASETISRAYKSKASFNATRASLTTWLRGICANVIRDYFRRANTQKRNFPGGLVSLDDVPEPRDENTRQAEHDVIDRANLSKKERDSVRLSLRGAKKHGTARKVSSSTIHRATEKIEQVRSDDRFQEEPHGPETIECGYGRIPHPEHGAALLYDFSRTTLWFVEAINGWRRTPEWNQVQSYLRSERTLKRFPLAVSPRKWPVNLYRYYSKANDHSPQLRRQFEAAIDIALAFLEWPSVGYCRLDSNERRRRLEEFGWTFGQEPFWEITGPEFDLFMGAVSASASEPPPPSDLPTFLEMINKAPQSGSHSFSSVHLIRIDWRFPPKSIVQSFGNWAIAKKRERQNIPTVHPAGRPRTGILLGYAYRRLTKQFGMKSAAAFSWLKRNYGAPVSTSPERIKRTAKRACDALKDFLPLPTEIGL
jgi:hypothetical protein